MKTKKNRQFFLVLVPHRDIRLEIQKHSYSLFQGNYTNMYSFPLVAPLASLSQELDKDELKHLARSLREAANWGKIHVGRTSVTAFPTGAEEMALFGPTLELDISQIFTRSHKEHGVHGVHGKIKTLFSPTVMGICLVPKDNEQQVRVRTEGTSLCGSWLNPLGFRAAALANMSWQPVQTDNEIMYKWKIGKLYWLPNQKKGQKSH
jgi:hypothetical protein